MIVSRGVGWAVFKKYLCPPLRGTMSFWTFLKSVPGKITMVATTAIAGVAANFAGAAMVKDDLEMDAIKKGIVDGGGNVDGLTDAQIMSGWENIKQVVETDPSVAEQAKTVYRLVNREFGTSIGTVF